MSIKSSGFSECILKLHQFYISGVRIIVKILTAQLVLELLSYAHPGFLTPGKFQLTITRFYQY